jgi:sugar O-acyltransferase (sialic acid O-acetyltransferase NeuD family)
MRTLIVGAGSQARYILHTLEALGERAGVVGLIDTFDNPTMWGSMVDGAEVLGGVEKVEEFPPSEGPALILAIANARQKTALGERFEKAGYRFRSAIHPKAAVSPTARIGDGAIINAGAAIEMNAEIGAHAIVHAGATVEHDNVLEPYANVGPGVSFGGRVRVKRAAIVYTGATVVPDVTLGEFSVVGAGSTVIRDVEPNTVVVGVPAKLLRRIDSAE